MNDLSASFADRRPHGQKTIRDKRFPTTGRHFADAPAPDRIRIEVARLMADGRWRTARDVAFRINAPVTHASEALKRMERMGLLESESINDSATMIKIYRKRGL